MRDEALAVALSPSRDLMRDEALAVALSTGAICRDKDINKDNKTPKL